MKSPKRNILKFLRLFCCNVSIPPQDNPGFALDSFTELRYIKGQKTSLLLLAPELRLRIWSYILGGLTFNILLSNGALTLDPPSSQKNLLLLPLL